MSIAEMLGAEMSPRPQYPIIRNGLIRNSAEFWGKFKKRALGRSNKRNASKNLRKAQCSDLANLSCPIMAYVVIAF